MKNLLSFLLVVALLFCQSAVFAGCGSCGDDRDSEEDDADSCGSCSFKGACGSGGNSPCQSANTPSPNTADQPSAATPKPEPTANINTSALTVLLKTKVAMTIIDARTGQYDDGNRIPGAKSLNDQSKAEEIQSILPNKESLIITYCSNLKSPASGNLAKHLKDLGYSNVVEYPEGIEGWKSAGNPVESTKKTETK